MTDDKHVFQPGDLVLVGDEPSLEDGSDGETLSSLSRCVGRVVIGPDEDGDILVEVGMGSEWYIGKSHLTPVSNEWLQGDKHVFQPGDLVLVGESPSLEDGSNWEILSPLSRCIGSVVTGIPDGDGDILVSMVEGDGPDMWYIGKSHLTPVSNERLQGGAE